MKKIRQRLLCNSTQLQTLYKLRDRMFDASGIFQCKKCTFCGLVFLDPQPGSDTLRKHYPSRRYFAHTQEGKTGFFGKIREYVISHIYQPTLLSKFLMALTNTSFAIPQYQKNGKVLDLGCGTGDILVLLKNLGWDVYGIDIDKNATQIAKERGLKNVQVGTYKAVESYPDNYFDAIRLYHVIEHVDDPLVCLQLLSKKLKPGGELLLATPNFNSPVRSIFGVYWGSFDSPRHLFLFTPLTLRRAIERYKLSVASIKYTSALGIAGSMQYVFDELTKRKGNFFANLPIIFAFYPIELLFDKVNRGDLFTMQVFKKS